MLHHIPPFQGNILDNRKIGTMIKVFVIVRRGNWKRIPIFKKNLHVTLIYRIYNLGIGLTEKVGIISINLIGV